MSASGRQEADRKCARLAADVDAQQLIPGLPDEITLSQVATKLPRIDIDTLFFVSRGWFHAIRSRQVYDARVLAGSTETVLFSSSSLADNVHKVTLFTASGKFRLPKLELPFLTGGFEREVNPNGRLVSSDGKVYVFGGLDGKVHVMDVAGHRQWKQCANVLNPKLEFGCGEVDGKIYIFGGGVLHESSSGTVVYNPRDNTSFPIRIIKFLLCSHRAPIVRRDVSFLNRKHGQFLHPNMASMKPLKNSDPLEVYDPVKDEWRVVQPVGTAKEIMFVAGKKFFSMSPLGVHIYDFHRNSWGDLRLFSFVGFAPVDPISLMPVAIRTEDAEVLAIVDWPNGGSNKSCMVQSRGLSSQDKEIMWYKPEYSDDQPPPWTVYLDCGVDL